ncbi:MAG TPA: pitrilysin family protein [Bryobacteraceae bacterium]|nr:pitrilysin family protein [Bryobacteraceae bacterium]
MPQEKPTGRDVSGSALANGIRVITETIPHVRSVAVGVWMGTGSRQESGEENGISHFIEHMVFKGTTNRSAEDIARSVDSIGGNLDAFTAKEMVSFNAKVLDEHLPAVFDILSDLVLHPLFKAEDIEKEKGVVLEELKMEADNPEYLVHELFSNNFWRDHPLGKPILGTRETVKRFTRETIENHYRKFYVPSNIVITAAGNLDHGKLLALAKERFEALPPNGSVPASSAPSTHARLCLRHKKSLEQLHLCLGFPCYPIPHEKRYAVSVLNTLLGGGMSSRLFQNIREKRGLAYAVFSEISAYRDTGCVSVYAGTSRESAREVVRLVLEEFRRLKDEPVPEEELRRAKDNLKGSLFLGLESTSSRMGNLARQHLYFGRFFTLDEMAENIERVTSGEIQQAAQAFFHSRSVALAAVGNLENVHISRGDLVC